jgi:RimJ/RimL family protein N-acetyltransferase
MLVSITPAEFSDLDRVEEIIADARKFIGTYNSPQWQIYYPTRNIFEESIIKNELYLLKIQDTIVGVFRLLDNEPTYANISGNWLDNTNNYYAIHSVAIISDYRNQKLSSEIFDFVAQKALKEHKSSLRIDTHELNVPMKKVLERNGFHYCGLITLTNSVDNIRQAYEKNLY